MYVQYGPLCTEVYEITKPVGQSVLGDIHYYKEQLAKCQGRILEPAVGSGRVLVPLLEAGFDVEGFDSSVEMLTACKKNCEDRALQPKVFEGRLQDFTTSNQYEAIIIPSGSFCLLHNRKEAMRALKNMFHHLTKGGKLLIDLLFPIDWESGKTTMSVFQQSDVEGIKMTSTSLSINWYTQQTETLITYEKWRYGKLVDTELQQFILQWYGVEEFSMMLEACGFTSITCSADYVYKKKPTSSSEVVTFEAYK